MNIPEYDVVYWNGGFQVRHVSSGDIIRDFGLNREKAYQTVNEMNELFDCLIEKVDETRRQD